MNKFYLIGKLSPEYVKGYMSNPDQDRAAIVGSAAEKAGGKLHSLEFVRGDFDMIATAEGDYESMLAMKVTALQSGMLNELIILDTKFDMVSTVKKANLYITLNYFSICFKHPFINFWMLISKFNFS